MNNAGNTDCFKVDTKHLSDAWLQNVLYPPNGGGVSTGGFCPIHPNYKTPCHKCEKKK